MKDVSYTVRSEIFKALRNKVNKNIPIYVGALPEDNQPDRWINILSQISQNISSKNCYITDQTVNIEVVVKTSQGLNRSDLDALSNSVMSNLDDFYFNTTDFHLCEFVFVNSRDLGTEFNGVDKMLRKIITFDVKVSEN